MATKVMMTSKIISALTVIGRLLNEVASFMVFCLLDIIDILLCFFYKAADFLLEAEIKSCYCLPPKEAFTSSPDKILVPHNNGDSHILSLSTSAFSKIQLEEISDTLYTRPSLLSELSSLSAGDLRKRLVKVSSEYGDHQEIEKARTKGKEKKLSLSMKMIMVVEMLQGKIRPKSLSSVSRWSDCDCGFCTCWASSFSKDQSLFVKTQFPKGKRAKEDVLFIHGFISSSLFWTETVFPNLSSSNYRLFAIDILGFGKSPKPAESLYTLREHMEMIEKSVLHGHEVKSFHIVAHSLGCILALALAVRHGCLIKSLTLLAPPYYPVPIGEAEPTQYVMRKVAPRRIWPPMAFGASMACWYEHISRTICLLICKNHRLWEFLVKLITRNRVRTYLMESFFSHTHKAAWHTLHNIICGTGSKLDAYLDIVRDKLKCKVTIFHGRDDQVIPVDCSYSLQRRVPRARVRVVDDKDHITLVVGRQKVFARELEEIWSSC